MKVNGSKMSGKEEELRSGQMDRCMKVIGVKEKQTAEEDLFMLMAMFMMGIGKMIRHMAREFTLT